MWVFSERTWRILAEKLCGQFVRRRSEKDRGNNRQKEDKIPGGEILSSIKKIKIPAEIANRKVSLTTNVVLSGIPLLWSQPSMTKVGVVLYLPSERVKILGK